jgi:hypothetical protein
LNCRRRFLIFDFRFGCEKLLAPGFALALGTLVDGVAYAEAVVAGLPVVAGKLAALGARIEGAGLGVAMLLIELVLADNAHEDLHAG